MLKAMLNLTAAVFACLVVTSPLRAASEPFKFTAKQVEQGVWQPETISQGQVLAEREVALSLPFATLIKTVPVYGDQSVKQGQVLARIDASPLLDLFSNLQSADKRVELARQHVSITRQRFNNKLAVQDDLIQAKEILNLAQRDLKKSWLSTNNVLLLMGHTVTEPALLKQLKENTADLVAHQNAEIRAPFDGVVAQRMVGPGTRLASGQSLFVLDDMSHVFVSLLIAPEQLTAWKNGEVYARTENGTVKLTLLSKVPSVDSTSGLVDLKFQADNPDGQFLDGEWLDVILKQTSVSAMWVPESAVVERDGKTYCIRQRGKQYESVAVTVGSPSNGRIPVLSGLQASDQVVVKNAYLLLYRDLKDIMKRAAD